MSIWGLSHSGVLHGYGLNRIQQAETDEVCISSTWVCLFSFAAYARHMAGWCKRFISFLCLSLPRLNGGWQPLHLIKWPGMVTSSIELPFYSGKNCLRPWDSLWFPYLSQSPKWIPKFHLPKCKAPVFFTLGWISWMFLYSFIQCCWSSHVPCFVQVTWGT